MIIATSTGGGRKWPVVVPDVQSSALGYAPCWEVPKLFNGRVALLVIHRRTFPFVCGGTSALLI